MSIQACAELVRIGDPDRFLSAMTVPPAQRGALFVLYAFNLELARAPYMSSEPLIGEMRLQFWRDVIDEATQGKSRAHEVAAPLAALIQSHSLPIDTLWQMIDARQWHIYKEPFADMASWHAHIKHTASNLFALAALVAGSDPSKDTEAAKTVGFASGVANWLIAAPAMAAAGRQPLEHASQADLRDTMVRALFNLRGKPKPPKTVCHILRAGWLAEPVLRRAIANPQRIMNGTLMPSEFGRRARLLWKQATGGY